MLVHQRVDDSPFKSEAFRQRCPVLLFFHGRKNRKRRSSDDGHRSNLAANDEPWGGKSNEKLQFFANQHVFFFTW